MQSGSSSTKPTRFDALSLLREIQSEPSPPSAAPKQPQNDSHQVEDEDDFMSDKFLITTQDKRPLTYTNRRRRLEAHHSSRAKQRKSNKEREEQARQEGLDRDLLAEAEIIAGGGKLPPEGKHGARRWDLMQRDQVGGAAENVGDDGTAKAMRMMLAMGYRRGEALGRQMQASTDRDGDRQSIEEEESEEEEGKQTAAEGSPDETDSESLDSDEEQQAQQARQASQERAEDEYLTGGISEASFTTKMEEPRSGIVHAQLEPLRPDQRWLGLHRRAGIGMIPKTSPDVAEAIRAKAASSRQSVAEPSSAESDFRTRISSAHQQRHNANLLSRARQALIHLDQSSSIQYNPLWLNVDIYRLLTGQTPTSLTNATIDQRMQTDPSFRSAVQLLQLAFSSNQQQIEEAKQFIELDTKNQLVLVLDCLRRDHLYCLFCGCQYTTAEQLNDECPGEEENDHD